MPLRIFPVSGGARVSNDFNAAPTTGQRAHAGNDIFAAEGTPLLAVDDGYASFGHDPKGGNIVSLRAPDGTRYYYAHLLRFDGGPRSVRAGDVVGYLGRTGNAVGTAPHLHFEIHPGGGAAIDPFPALRRATIARPGAPSGTSRIALGLAVAGLVGVGAWWLSQGEGRYYTRRYLGTRTV